MKPRSLQFESTPHYTFWGRSSGILQRWLPIALLLLLLACLSWLVAQTLQVAKDTQSLKMQLVEFEAADAVKPTKSTSPKTTPSRSLQRGLDQTLAADLSEDTRRNLNTVIRQLNTPWQDLFDQLESLTPNDVALLSIEPDARRRSIKLLAEAKTLDSLLVYAAGLEQQGVFGRLTYSKYETNEQDSNKPTRLSFELELRTPERLDFIKNSPLAFVVPTTHSVPATRERNP